MRRLATRLCRTVLHSGDMAATGASTRVASHFGVPRHYSVKVEGRGQDSKHDNTGKPPPRVQYMPIEDVEPIERYEPGGFHPVAIGDKLHNGRYSIVHKLGFGGYSTIWLARDERSNEYVAIKIAAAGLANGSQECRILRQLAQTGNVSHPGRASVRQLLDEFTLNGPNGEHCCTVMPPGRMSVFAAKDASYGGIYQPHIARAIIAQLVHAVDFLHSNGVVHGDLHLGNVLLRLPYSISHLSPEQLYEKYGRPRFENITRLDGQPIPPGVPSQGIMPVWLGTQSEKLSLSEARIILSDFGESFMPSLVSQKRYCRAPPLLVPPEARFSQRPLSFPADIWCLACAIWEILGQRPLFETFFPTQDSVTAEQVDVLGKLPAGWWEQWETREQWFIEVDGELKENPTGPMERRPWKSRFEFSLQGPRKEKNFEEMGEDEQAALFPLLKSMLMYRPEERATVKDVLGSEWMRKWALPDLEHVA